MPRRIPDYPDAFAGWNAVCSYGSYISVIASCLFFYIVYLTFTTGTMTSENPWATTIDENVSTLEWNLPSPPAYHTFEEIPSVKADFMITK